MSIPLFLFALLSIAGIRARPNLVTGRACNCSPQLCSLPYDEVTYLGAHDSSFIHDASSGYSSIGDQICKATVQLDAGVRLLTAQLHVVEHVQTNPRGLHEWLWEIRTWLDANPNEVLTLLLINTSRVHAQELVVEYSRADHALYDHILPEVEKAPSPSSKVNNQAWPTLGDMITMGQSLVTFVNPVTGDNVNAPYLLNEIEFVWDNANDVKDPKNFDCTPDRPSNKSAIQEQYGSGRLFLGNRHLHWKQGFGIETANTRRIPDNNSGDGPDGRGTHMRRSSSAMLRRPTSVLVNFFNAELAMDIIDDFNGVRGPVGRKLVTDETVGGGSGRKMVGNVGIADQALTMALVVTMAMAVIFDLNG